MTNCKTYRSHLEDLLLDSGYAASHPEVAAHVKSCADCHSEFAGLKATFALMDEWTAPEVTPYFDTRMKARLREAAEARPEGFFERIRSFLLFSTGRHLRPAIGGALALLLIAGGAGIVIPQYVNHPQASATVNDLKILDNNAQALQQMDQLLDDSGSPADDGGSLPTT